MTTYVTISPVDRVTYRPIAGMGSNASAPITPTGSAQEFTITHPRKTSGTELNQITLVNVSGATAFFFVGVNATATNNERITVPNNGTYSSAVMNSARVWVTNA